MYIFPGYINHREEQNTIYVKSSLYKNEVKLTDPAIQTEFVELVRHAGCDDLNTPLTQFLHEQGMLLTEAEIDQEFVNIREVLDSILMLTFLPSEGCNFRCPYCYENHIPNHISRNEMDRIEEFLIDQAPHYKTINIGWFGGEPLLCTDTVLEVCDLVQSLQKKYAFHYYANMTTNGYLLTEKTFLQLYNGGISQYHITLDGWDHDDTRPHVSGKGTLNTIIRNLLAISQLPPETFPFTITLRHNILAGDKDFSWYDYLYRLFGKDERFQVYVHPVDDWGGASVHKLNLPSQQETNALIKEHLNYLQQIGMKCSNMQQEACLFGKVCYACYPHGMIFRANGIIEKCTLCLDHPKNAVGRVDPDSGVQIDEAANSQWSYPKLKPACRTCPEVLQCMNMRCGKKRVIDGTFDSACDMARLRLY